MIADFCKRFNVSRDEIRWHHMTADTAAGPVYITGYRNLIPPYETDGIYYAGMFSSPPNYPERSMEDRWSRHRPSWIGSCPPRRRAMTEYEVCAILPVYNDREALEIAIPRSIEVLEGITDSFLLAVAEDGSTDGSAEFVQEWETKDSRVRLFHADERLGRGGTALTRVIRAVDADIVCYYDVDLATDMAHLPALVQAIRDGSDVATGSRLMPESDIVRTQEREVASRGGYNFLVRTVLKSRLYDHQCGFKHSAEAASSRFWIPLRHRTGSGTPNFSSGRRKKDFALQSSRCAGGPVTRRRSGSVT